MGVVNMARLDEIADGSAVTLTQAKKLAEREKKLLDLIDDCSTLLNKLGTCSSDVHSWYTTDTREIGNLNGFTIADIGPNTMYGGNSLKISYKGEEVLRMYYWETARDRPSYEVYHYRSGAWEGHLGDLVKNVNEEVKRQTARRKEREEAEKQQEVEKKRLEAVTERAQDTARRLGPYLS